MLYHTTNPHGGDVYDRKIQLDFSANTNPYGTPQAVLDAMSAVLTRVHQYPDPYCRELVDAISEFEGVPKDWILCGSGAAELIYSYCEALHPRRAMELAPTFSEYALALERVGCRVERYSLKKENHFSLTEEFLPVLARIRPDVLFLCNPNNPTGQVIGLPLLEKILNLCHRQGTALFVDECFLDLSDDGVSLKARLGEHPKLFLLKAFTKIYAMAGIRLGYGLFGSGKMAARVQEAGQSWSVSGPAQTAGIAALTVDGYEEKTVSVIERERIYLDEELRAMGLRCYPAEADFLLFCVLWDTEEGYKGRGLAERLLEKGTAIRSCENYEGLRRGYYRIAVKNHEENALLLEQIKECLSGEEEHAEVHA